MKRIFKRALPLLLVLVLGLMPALSLQADAATTLDGQITITDTKNNGSLSSGTFTATAPNSSYSSSTTNSITVKNTSGSKATVSFTYVITGVGTGDSAYIGSESKKNGTYTYNGTLAKDATVVFQISSWGKGTVTLKLSSFSLTPLAGSGTVALTYDSTYGTVTDANGTLASGATHTVATATGMTATAKSGGVFVAWVNTSDGSFVSADANYYPEEDSNLSLTAKFVSNTTALFGVGTARYDDLTEAATAATADSSKKIVLLNNGTISGNYTIPSGVTLLIPFDSSYKLYGDDPETIAIPNNVYAPHCSVYRKLTLAPNTTITVNGAIEVGAKHYCAHGGKTFGGVPVDGYGQIEMGSGSAITLNSGAKLYAWGYVTGSGSVTAKSGATIYEKFQVTDYRGGTRTDSVVGKGVFPFSQYYIQNVEVSETIEAGASLVCQAAIYGLWVNESSLNFMDNENAMFALSSGSITKRYDASKDRLILDVNGDISLNPITIMGKDTSNFILPLNNNITVNVKSGHNVTVNQDLMLQPGASVNLEKDATMTVQNNMEVYVMDSAEWGTFCFGANMRQLPYIGSRAGAPVSRTLTDAQLDINGTLITNGSLYVSQSGASIVSIGKTGKIEMNTAAPDVSTVKQCTTGGEDTMLYTDIPVKAAVLTNGTGVTPATVATEGAAAGTVYDYCATCDKWVNSITVTFDANGGENAVTGTMEPLKTHAGCTGKLTANAFAIDGMKFKEWNTEAAPSEETPGTAYADEAVISETNITANTTLYAQWEKDGMRGDLDLDKDVDAYDLTLLAQHVGGVESLTDATALTNADVTGDGAIDANDMTLHACYVGGVITDWDEAI